MTSYLKRFGLLTVAWALASCASTDISPARTLYEAGDYELAALKIDELHPHNLEKGVHDRNRSEDNVWLLLEKGKMLADAGKWAESNIAFYEANQIFNNLDDEAKLSMGGIRSGAASILIDDRQSDYVGNSYDRILLPAYVCLNHLMLGETEPAAIAARQFADAEAQAREARSGQEERIRQMEGEAGGTNEDGSPKHPGFESADGQSGYLAMLDSRYSERSSSAESDPQSVSEIVTGLFSDAQSMADWADSSYRIPFAQFMGAMALAANGDLGEAEHMYAPIRQKVGAPLQRERTAYVVFDTGNAPKREDRSVSFIYFYKGKVKTKDGQVKEVAVPSYVNLPFVGLAKPTAIADHLQVVSGDNSTQTIPVCDTAGIIAQDFADSLPEIIARVLIRALIQEVAQIAANEQLGAWSVIGGALLKALVEPDLRSWESLGAQQQIAQIPIAEDGRVTLTLQGGGVQSAQNVAQASTTLDLTVPVGPPVLIYVRSTNLGNFIAHSCPLTKGPSLTP